MTAYLGAYVEQVVSAAQIMTCFHCCSLSAGAPDVTSDVCQVQFHVTSRISAVFSLMFVHCAFPSVTAHI